MSLGHQPDHHPVIRDMEFPDPPSAGFPQGVSPTSRDAARRHALWCAAAYSQGPFDCRDFHWRSLDPEKVVDAARVFERYLLDG